AEDGAAWATAPVIPRDRWVAGDARLGTRNADGTEHRDMVSTRARRIQSMERRYIGSLEVSVVGLGGNNFGWRLDADATTRVVHAALDAGITLFDTAELYGEGRSEEYLGRALRGRRQNAVIATKFGYRNAPPDRRGQPANVHRAADASLKRLGTDFIDLFQLHSPDPNVPIDETLGALDDLV